jgi:alanine racemase
MEYPTWAEIDISALKSNVRKTREIVGREIKILLTIKADAYGHGSRFVARAAVAAGVDALGVATLHEGIELRNADVRVPIVILSPSLKSEIHEILEHGLIPTVSDMAFAEALSSTAEHFSHPAKIHVEVDTGMTRGGVNAEDAFEFLKAVTALPSIEVEGVYTHFPVTYSEDREFTVGQVRAFTGLLDRLSAEGVTFPLVHTANSAAIVEYGESHLNMVRPGGMIYGMFARKGVDGRGIRPVMSLKSRVVNVKVARAGSTVSYGRTHKLHKDTRVASVAVGYGHGLSRALSDRGSFLVRGERLPIIGRVTMDVTLIDASSVNVEVGDEVVIFGKQAESEISVYEVARACRTIPYEVTCSIGKRVPRVYIEDGKILGAMTLIGERLPRHQISL